MSRPNMEMIERKCVAMEKPLPAEDPMDAEELVDPTFRHDHKVPTCPYPAQGVSVPPPPFID